MLVWLPIYSKKATFLLMPKRIESALGLMQAILLDKFYCSLSASFDLLPLYFLFLFFNIPYGHFSRWIHVKMNIERQARIFLNKTTFSISYNIEKLGDTYGRLKNFQLFHGRFLDRRRTVWVSNRRHCFLWTRPTR